MSTEQYQEELNTLIEIRQSLVKKRNSYRLQEAKTSDVSTLHTIETNIESTNKKIEDVDLEIAELKSTIETTKIPTKVEINTQTPIGNAADSDSDIHQAIELLKQEMNELINNSSKKKFPSKDELKRIHSLRTKIYDGIFKDVNNQLDFITSNKELLYSSVLFDTIYTSETIDAITATEIQKIRQDYENYKWYDRSVIISALSLSLINFKFDAKKANLLLDFVTDFESNGVWERALTGLLIAILYQKNRGWERASNFVNRLKTLQNNDEIQEGIKIIDFILRNELYKFNLFNPNLFKMDLFENPMNCFVPFYDNNEILTHAISNADNDFDIEHFQKYLDNMPLLDSHKYALCIGLSENNLANKKMESETLMKVVNTFNISNYLNPYQNLISDFFCFFNYFPKKLVDDVFTKQLILTNTSLRSYVLKKTMQLLLEANTLFNEDNYSAALPKYQDLLRIDSNHKEARWQLANCYLAKEKNNEALDIFLKLEKEVENNVDIGLSFKIALCYYNLKKYIKSLEYCKKIEKKIDTPAFNHLRLMADNYVKQKDYKNAVIYCKRAENKASDEEDLFRVATIYYDINEYQDSIRIIKKLLESKSMVTEYSCVLGQICSDLSEWDLAILAFEKIEKKDDFDGYYQMIYARALFLSQIDFAKAKILLNKALKTTDKEVKGMVFGNMGHLCLIESNNEEAFENYLKCLEHLKDIQDFSKRMESDAEYIVKTGITIEDYKNIENRVIENYRLKK